LIGVWSPVWRQIWQNRFSQGICPGHRLDLFYPHLCIPSHWPGTSSLPNIFKCFKDK
jgi:hypothetical protein